MILKDSSVPLYKQLKDRLLQDIKSGSLSIDSRVASERELSLQYGISRMTARRAIEELVRQRYLIRIIGKGTYVSSAQRTSEFIRIVSFTEDMTRQGYVVQSKVLRFQEQEPTGKVTEMLNLGGNGRVFCLERIRFANHLPIAIQVSYLPQALCPRLREHDFSRDSLYQVLSEKLGLALSFSSNSLESRISSEEEMRRFKLSRQIGVFVLEQTTFLEQGEPIEFVTSIFRGDRFKFYNIAAGK